MIFAELKAYLMARGRVAMPDLASHFDTTPDALRGMLDHWTRKGRVRRLEAARACASCHKCAENLVEVYEWTGPTIADRRDTANAAFPVDRAFHCSGG